LDDPSNIPDPYVKLHLLPDKAKEHKRKTKVYSITLLNMFEEKDLILDHHGQLQP